MCEPQGFQKDVPITIDVAEELRPRVYRQLGLPLKWDAHVDALPSPKGNPTKLLFVKLLRLYRHIRPTSVGNRCAFEPSCSRYSEMCFRDLNFWYAIRLTLSRLQRCKAKNGGLDLPPVDIK